MILPAGQRGSFYGIAPNIGDGCTYPNLDFSSGIATGIIRRIISRRLIYSAYNPRQISPLTGAPFDVFPINVNFEHAFPVFHLVHLLTASV